MVSHWSAPCHQVAMQVSGQSAMTPAVCTSSRHEPEIARNRAERSLPYSLIQIGAEFSDGLHCSSPPPCTQGDRTEVYLKQAQKSEEFLKHVFTADEKRDFAEQLAKTTQDLEEVRLSKKQVTKDFDAQISAKEAAMNSLSRKYNNGYEMRMVETEIHFNLPSDGTKTILRTDTGEIVREMAMEPYEMQDELPMEVGD